MTDLRRAAEAVLERWDSPAWEWKKQGPTADLMANLRKALAAEQPKPEPVAWMFVNLNGECEQIEYATPPTDDDSITPLYIAPPDIEALRRDAERYRWMATGDTRRRVCNILPLFNAYAYRKEHIDAAIDAAMGDKR